MSAARDINKADYQAQQRMKGGALSSTAAGGESEGYVGLENAAGHSINNVIVDTMVMIVRLAKIEKKMFSTKSHNSSRA